ncbi:MAG: isoleucyl-tRNA synthetase [Parcubacteria group bacterium Licking1014_1]|nr:MAG: isoleucyl-tRNA synthetase [Parcubacteria group bacterium Licking1014_1]
MSYNFPEAENKILKFWQENKIFEKLRKKNKGGKRWSFLDGPITANNPMGVHHAWGRTYKDLFQRYKAMQGFDERYQNGFDCQGLWVEVEVEKELGFKNKKDIEEYGIDKFVEKCKERVKKYSQIQTQQSIRLGQWMDWENSYYTMSDKNNYAIWHFLKKCWQEGYLYKGRDSVPWCPRCGTAISQHEILTEEYKEIIHDSIYFELPIDGRKDEYLLVWTTTPWTLPANIAVAVDEKIKYSLVQGNTGDNFWVAKDLADKIFKKDYRIIKTVKGEKLIGLKYIFAFDNLPKVKEAAEKFPDKFHIVIATDDRIMPITAEDGTGLVHTAVSAGQEDFQLGKKLGLPLIDVIDEEANYLEGLGEFSGKNAKKNPKIILDYLVAEDKKGKNWVFSILPHKHKYPICWRCKTELVWRVVDEWYISMKKLRKPLVEITKKINWIPGFGLERELDWLKNMNDWLISKKRYWGLALPIFECQCGNFEVIGSKEELKKRAAEGRDKFEGNSPHRPWVDEIKIKCKKCGKLISRIKDVGNPWLDAGIVSFSTIKYFEDKTYWRKWFPAELVCESFPGQFKNWFYSFLVMSAVLENKNPVKTIFGYASVRDEKGEEMHKSKGNAIWFDEAVEKIGADPMRWLYAKQNPAENLGFGYNVAEEIKRKLLVLYNAYVFFNTYVSKSEIPNSKFQIPNSKNILDRWIISKMDNLISATEFNLEKYDIARVVSNMEDFFINDLSLWYIRRSRSRFHEQSPDKKEAVSALYCVLLNFTKLIAPVVPFFAEEMYQSLRLNPKSQIPNPKLDMPESVHLCDWPQLKGRGQIDMELESKMDEARSIVTLALAQRAEKQIKVKQPLASLKIRNPKSQIRNYDELLQLIKDEVNVKNIIFDDKIKKEVELDTEITEELKEEGLIREIIRHLQDMRKSAGLKPADKISIFAFGQNNIINILEKNKNIILKEARAKEIYNNQNTDFKFDIKKEILLYDSKLFLAVKKIRKV